MNQTVKEAYIPPGSKEGSRLMSMCGSLLRACSGSAAWLLAVVVAVALVFAVARSGTASQPQPGEVEIMHRLTLMQQELNRKAELTNDALRQLAEKLVQKMEEINAEKMQASPQPESETGKPRLDELEKRLNRLLRYVKDVEKSIAKIDTNLSTPAVLEKVVVDRKKALARP